ncbi:Lactate/malate dehydrogenase, N-terminal [Dillenia turbinata]|uniref:Malate dehydrogenase n=1 Tax=Dillenia turbinata TaxID=194707 RepID=A0AAN8UT54_9MAGN
MQPNAEASQRIARISAHLHPSGLQIFNGCSIFLKILFNVCQDGGKLDAESSKLSSKRRGAPGFKVAILGTAGGIGQPPALLMKMNPLVSVLHLYDGENTPSVTADIGHMDTSAVVRGFLAAIAGECSTGMDLVIIPAGISKCCPNAIVNLISNPVNSTVPIAAEVFKKAGTYDPKRLLGVTMLDVVRANTFMAEVLGLDPREDSGPVKLPALSPLKKLEYLTNRIQNGGTEVVEAKAGTGSATLSMAYAAVKFADACLRGLRGDAGVAECAFVASQGWARQGKERVGRKHSEGYLLYQEMNNKRKRMLA